MFLRNIPRSHAFVMGVGWGEELHYVLYYGTITIYYGFKFSSLIASHFPLHLCQWRLKMLFDSSEVHKLAHFRRGVRGS